MPIVMQTGETEESELDVKSLLKKSGYKTQVFYHKHQNGLTKIMGIYLTEDQSSDGILDEIKKIPSVRAVIQERVETSGHLNDFSLSEIDAINFVYGLENTGRLPTENGIIMI